MVISYWNNFGLILLEFAGISIILYVELYSFIRLEAKNYLGISSFCKQNRIARALQERPALIPEFRARFNSIYRPDQYLAMLALLEERCGIPIEFRVAESPIFLPRQLLNEIAETGSHLCRRLVGNRDYLAAASRAIPSGYRVAAETAHPHFLTADFALIHEENGREGGGQFAPRLVEMQAFPSVYAYQAALNAAYREIFSLDTVLGAGLGTFLSGLDEAAYWRLLGETILGSHDPETVVLTEVDPLHQKTRPDFEVTARRLGIAVVDIATLEPDGDRLTYRNAQGRRIPVARIYNRAIADELIARRVRLPFNLEADWNVEWAGHPNWYFLISKFSIPFLCRAGGESGADDTGSNNRGFESVVPPAVFLSDFLAGSGRERLEAAGVSLPALAADAVYSDLLLKPLFSFAGKGIQFDPTQAQLEAIPPAQRGDYLLQKRMSFVPTIETPFGLTQAEIRILYLWPDGGELTPVLSLIRLGRGRMMGVDYNRNQQWVGASGAFFPVAERCTEL